MPDKTGSPILLLGSYGRGNVGDDIFLLAATELFAGRRIYINASDDSPLPANVQGKVSTISTASLRGIIKKVRVFLAVKTIVYWGGDVWVEWGEGWRRRQPLYMMAVLNSLARLFGKEIYYIGCGIGDVRGYSRWLARISARLSKQIVVRERRSVGVLGLPQVSQLPDLAINVPFNRPKLHRPPKGRKFVVGISILYHLPEPEQRFPILIEQLARFMASLPKTKFEFVLVPMLVSNHEPKDDAWASEQLRDALPPAQRDIAIFRADSLEAMVAKLASLDLVIGARLHTNILAALNATPCLGIAYRPKVASFFLDNGLGYYCLDLDKLDGLERVFWSMYNDYKNLSWQFLAVAERNLKERAAYQKLAKDL